MKKIDDGIGELRSAGAGEAGRGKDGQKDCRECDAGRCEHYGAEVIDLTTERAIRAVESVLGENFGAQEPAGVDDVEPRDGKALEPCRVIPMPTLGERMYRAAFGPGARRRDGSLWVDLGKWKP